MFFDPQKYPVRTVRSTRNWLMCMTRCMIVDLWNVDVRIVTDQTEFNKALLMGKRHEF